MPYGVTIQDPKFSGYLQDESNYRERQESITQQNQSQLSGLFQNTIFFFDNSGRYG